MDKNLICSVVIPVYNAEKFIKDTLNSVLNQTVKDIEIICVDDCSTDKSAEIISSMQQLDDRIILLKNEKNSKVSQTRNNGINFAHSDWIALLDADDMWEPNYLEEILKRREQTNGKMFFTAASFISNDGESIEKKFFVKEVLEYKNLLKQNSITCSSVFIQKSLLQENPFYADDVHEDYLCWLNILKKIKYAYGVNKPLVIYRLTKGSKSRNKFKAIKMSFKTYRKHGLNLIKSWFYTFCNAINGLKKYKGLKVKK